MVLVQGWWWPESPGDEASVGEGPDDEAQADEAGRADGKEAGKRAGADMVTRLRAAAAGKQAGEKGEQAGAVWNMTASGGMAETGEKQTGAVRVIATVRQAKAV